ncbi:hypothetical protein BX600DRAFT_437934 [Xylariales sp. PMI_506]|nr:hypothetical protein BX600DRAFT_437934 [Xylariales sp. PMI_506]
MDAPEVVQPAQAGLEALPPEFQHYPHQPEESAGLEVRGPPQPMGSESKGLAITAGLEVAHPGPPGPDVHELPTTKNPSGGTESENALAANRLGTKGRLCGLRRRDFWLGCLVLLLVIIAAVLGGELGTRKSTAGPAATATATSTATITTSTSTSTSTPTSIGANSRLAVTGWTTGQEYSIRLFFQGPDDLLRYSAYESTSGSWAEPVKMQFELYYLDESSYLRAQDFSPGVTGNGSFSFENFAASPSSQLSTYWPSLIYEGADGSFFEVTYAGNHTVNIWNAQAVAQAGALVSGSGVVELTTTPNYTSLSFFSQDSSGALLIQERDVNNSTWKTTAGQAIASIPEGSSLGALYTPAIGGNDANVYVLWQDVTGDIKVSDLNSGWSGSSTPDAFKNAVNGTSIACLTPVSFYNVSLGTVPSLARCYFRTNAAVREVEVTGGQWQILGDVPIP